MRAQLVEFLSGLPGFRVLVPGDIERLLDVALKRRFKAGSYIFRKGEAGNTLLVVTHGRAKVPIRDAKGHVTTDIYFERGAVLGEIGLLLDGPRTADVIADGEVRGLVLERHHVLSLISAYPSLGAFLTELLGERLERDGLNHVGKYKLLRTIGRGGFSRVYSALHPTLGRTVAIKMLSHALVLKDDFRAEFIKEARTIASLDHPNIVRVFDVEEDYATIFLVMEELRGATLAKIVKKHARRIPPEDAMNVLRQLAAALRYAHGRGVIHRDLKPDNVGVDPDGHVKLMDFGIARRVAPGDTLDEDEFTGTPRYMAPEYIAGKPAGGGVDIYALGVMAFEMVSGRRMFQTTDQEALLLANRDMEPPDLASIDPTLPEGLVTFVREAVRKDPARRISSWPRIERLLTQVEEAPEVVEMVVRVRYPKPLRRDVSRLIQPVLDELAMRPEISVATSQLEEHAAGERTLVFPRPAVDDPDHTEVWLIPDDD